MEAKDKKDNWFTGWLHKLWGNIKINWKNLIKQLCICLGGIFISAFPVFCSTFLVHARWGIILTKDWMKMLVNDILVKPDILLVMATILFSSFMELIFMNERGTGTKVLTVFTSITVG